MAAYAIQFRRGTTTQHNSFTGLLGEVTVDTDKNTLVVHDGSTVGGFPLAREGAASTASTGTFTSNVLVGGTMTVSSTAEFNDDVTIVGDLGMTGHIIPSANVTYDLGSTTMMWRDVYVGPGSLYINGSKVLEDNSGTIRMSADTNQNIKVETLGTGALQLVGANGIQVQGDINSISGDIMVGDHIDMQSSLIKGVATPISVSDAANKAYVDATAGAAVTSGTNAISGTTGAFSSNVTIAGNLTVSGTTTQIETQTLSVADNIIDLNSDFTTGTPTENAGIRVLRGDDNAVQIRWNETAGNWEMTNDGATYQAIGSLASSTTTDLSEGDNLYFTDARAQDAALKNVVGGNNITVSYNETSNELTINGASAYGDSDVDTYLYTTDQKTFRGRFGAASGSNTVNYLYGPLEVGGNGNYIKLAGSGTSPSRFYVRRASGVDADFDILSYTSNDEPELNAAVYRPALEDGTQQSNLNFEASGNAEFTLGGYLDVNGSRIVGLAEPTGSDNAATKAYVDTQISSNAYSDSDVASFLADGNKTFQSITASGRVEADELYVERGGKIYLNNIEGSGNDVALQFKGRDGSNFVREFDLISQVYNRPVLHAEEFRPLEQYGSNHIRLRPNTGGHVYVSNAQIKSVAAPTSSDDAANKSYVDGEISTLSSAVAASAYSDSDVASYLVNGNSYTSTSIYPKNSSVQLGSADGNPWGFIAGELITATNSFSVWHQNDRLKVIKLENNLVTHYAHTYAGIGTGVDIRFATSGSANAKFDLNSGHMDLMNSQIKNVGTPTDTTDAANKAYVDQVEVDAKAYTDVSITDTLSGDVTIGGNLTVSGTTTTVNTETVNLADNIILLNSNATGGATQNGGIEIERGDDLNVQFIWDETNDRWSFVSKDVYTSGNFLGDVIGTVSSLSNHDTDDLIEGSSNLYFTAERAQDAVADMLTAGTGISMSYDDANDIFYIENTQQEIYLASHAFDTTDGILTSTLNNGDVVSVDLDGRFALQADLDSAIANEDYVTSGAFNTATGEVTLTRALGGTVSYDLDGRYVLQSEFDANDNHLTGHAFDTETGIFTSTLADASTVTVDLDGRYLLASDFDANDNHLTGLTFAGDTGILTATLADASTVTVDLDGRYVESVTAGAGLSNSGTDAEVTLDINVGTGLEIVTASDAISIANTGVSNGTYGDAGSAVTLTVNEQGQLTSAGAVAISITASQVSNFNVTARSLLSGAGSVSYDPVTGVITGTDTNDIDYINAASFNTSTGVLSLTGVGNAGASVDLDGRYVNADNGFTYAHSVDQTVSAAVANANATSSVNFTFAELEDAVHYTVYLNRQLLRPGEFTVSTSAATNNLTISSGILAEDDELEVVTLKVANQS